MAGRDRRVRGEDASGPNALEIPFLGGRVLTFSKELKLQEARMAFVQMESLQLSVAQCAKHPEASDAQQDLLCQPVAFIPPVQVGGQLSIALRVGFDVGIQEQQGHHIARRPDDVMLPCTDNYGPAFNQHVDCRWHQP